MTFNSLLFIFCFLPILMILYYIVRLPILRNIVLVLFSFLFYSWLDPSSLVLMVVIILWNYLTGIEIERATIQRKKRIALISGVVFNVGILCIYKYFNFFFGFLPFQLTLSMPIGLSFFTFSAISYIADVYMGKVECQYNLLELSLYISFFGKVSMGPIVQYGKMRDQLKEREIDQQMIGLGLRLFVIGLIKKVIFADQFALLWSNLANNTSVAGTWLYAISYMLQIYFDFSGYSDMAIGISRIFGFEFEPNFDHPYMATSVQDFWRRWHISLSRWFRDYIYIPLGGSRVENKVYVRNIFVVWLCTGLWHGANFTFILWGLYFGCILLIEKFWLKKILDKLPNIFGRLYTLFIVLISWVLFMSPSIIEAFQCMGRMFGIGTKALVDVDFRFMMDSYGFWIFTGIIFCTNIYDYIENIIFKFRNGEKLLIGMYILLFFVAIAFIVASTFQSFLYFAF
ncbi:MAG: MBOAT family protein [Holdemanella sp.]|nr:MBOAT family protein [Holdemanella sp.]